MAGECSAYYAVYGGRITKTKQNCQNVEIAGEYENVNKVNNLAINLYMYMCMKLPEKLQKLFPFLLIVYLF